MKSTFTIKLFTAFLFATVFSNVNAQTLISGAESVSFDTLNNRYLVSSLNTNKIISIDEEGNQSIFKESIQAFGNCIKDNIFYVSGGTHVRGVDVTTAEIIMDVNIPGTQQLDGVTTDDDGNLYVVETIRNWIYKINLFDNTVTQFASAGAGNFPQDIIYDKFNNRLLLVFWHSNSSILSIDLETATVDTAVATETGFFDGITIDNEGNVYVASHDGEGKIIMYNNDFTNPPAVISEGYDEPAGLDVNLRDNILAIPSFAGNRVDFIKLPAQYITSEVSSSEPRGHVPHKVSFNASAASSKPISSWEWDFDSDGNIDSYDEDPDWEYNGAGTFTVTLQVYADTLVDEVILKDYVQAFNGESAIEFNGNGGSLIIDAVPELALYNVWTFSSWIKPLEFGRNILFYKNALQIYTNNNKSSSLNANSLVVRIYKEEGGYETLSTPDSSLITNEWHHVAVSYDYNAKRVGVYINGEQVIFAEADSNIFSSVIKNNDGDNIIIGNNLFGIRNFDGVIDNVELWMTYMNAGEIKDLMQSKRAGNEDGLAGFWSMDEGSGTQIVDETSNGNIGILTDGLFTHGVDINLYTDVNSDNSRISNIVNGFSLYQNYPNPFNPETTIMFTLEKPSHIILNVFNSTGELVKSILSGNIGAGTHRSIWDGTSDNGNKVVSGIYFYSLSIGEKSHSRKMILLK